MYLLQGQILKKGHYVDRHIDSGENDQWYYERIVLKVRHGTFTQYMDILHMVK